jgi:hypothetical protein
MMMIFVVVMMMLMMLMMMHFLKMDVTCYHHVSLKAHQGLLLRSEGFVS